MLGTNFLFVTPLGGGGGLLIYYLAYCSDLTFAYACILFETEHHHPYSKQSHHQHYIWALLMGFLWDRGGGGGGVQRIV